MKATSITPEAYARRLKEGYGQGRGVHYVPWLHATKVSSIGTASEIRGLVTGRDHQLLSGVERCGFHRLDRRPGSVDIREGFPLLPIEMTWDLAKELGVRPAYKTKARFHVMTTDFLYEEVGGRQVAIAVKTEEQLVTSTRVGELLAIEQAYWHEVGIEFEIWTDEVLTQQSLYTLDALYDHRELPEDMPGNLVDACHQRLTDALYHQRSLPLAQVCLSLDERCRLPRTTHLYVLLHLAYLGVIDIDVTRRFQEFDPHILREGTLTSIARRVA